MRVPKHLQSADQPLRPLAPDPTAPEREDSRAIAKAAGLRFVSDATPGIKRQRVGRGFRYLAPDGQVIRDNETLKRIRMLAIPPAWKDVWICPSPRGHIQATGYDAKGRKQYHYHPRWRETRDETKYEHMQAFGAALPTIRRRVEQDITQPELPREKALAAVVQLLDMTAIRIGNEQYASENGSYGLTTLRNEHVEAHGERIRLQFNAKGGKWCTADVRDRRLARIVKRSLDLPGERLFQYIGSDGAPHSVTSEDVNGYLQEITCEHITAKDFRTWLATLTVARILGTMEQEPDGQTGATDAKRTRGRALRLAKKQVTQAIKVAAEVLGNTPAICRKSYVHPQIVEAYLRGDLQRLWQSHDETLGDELTAEEIERQHQQAALGQGLDADERQLLGVLRKLEAKSSGAAVA